MIYQLSPYDCSFPDPESIPPSKRDPHGIFAIGGDLRTERLLNAYSQGIFPWSDFRCGELVWYCPMQRFVIIPSEIHISHSMRTCINSGKFEMTLDHDFEHVIGRCSQKRIHEEGAWLGPRMVNAYTRLHRLGYAHSIEVWHQGEIVGGLYGVQLMSGFMGESMFSDMPNASKMALIALARLCQERGITMIDCQMETAHLKSMGGRYISYDEYMDLLYQP